MVLHFDSKHRVRDLRFLNIHVTIRDLTCIDSLVASLRGRWLVVTRKTVLVICATRHNRVIQVVLVQKVVQPRSCLRAICCPSSNMLLLGSRDDNSLSLRGSGSESFTNSFQLVSCYNFSLGAHLVIKLIHVKGRLTDRWSAYSCYPRSTSASHHSI